VEWFTTEALREVVPPGSVAVHGVAELHEGVLQRFVQPRGQFYFSTRATWSPNVRPRPQPHSLCRQGQLDKPSLLRCSRVLRRPPCRAGLPGGAAHGKVQDERPACAPGGAPGHVGQPALAVGAHHHYRQRHAGGLHLGRRARR
jgi:hypothetical protein